jgi:hypothetical protein
MPRFRFQTRLQRLERQAQHTRVVPQPILLVQQYAGETRDTALQAAGYTPEEVSGRLVVFLRRPRPREEEGDPSQSLI